MSRTAAGNREYFDLNSLIKSHLVISKTKLLIYKVLIKPIIMHGSVR